MSDPTALLSAPTLTAAGVIHAFSGALAGAEEERAFAAAAAPGHRRIARLRQVHGALVVEGAEAAAAAERREGDALVSAEAGIALVVATADCLPILLADPAAGLIAAVHAGWRGMRARVIARTLDALVARGAEAERIRAAVGPAVQGSCYEVGPEVRAEFEAAFPGDAARLFRDRHLDLVRAARAELERGGVPPEAVSVLELCTHCRPELASHRRQGRARGTNLALVALSG